MRSFSLCLLLSLLLVGCHQTRPPAPKASSSPAPIKAEEEGRGEGLVFTLSDGQALQDSGEAQVKQADAKPLSPEQVEALLSRLPALTSKPEVSDFAIRSKSLPPPQTAVAQEAGFPPAPSAQTPAAESKPLEVLRHAPEGEVPVGSQISLSFNQPMVPLASYSELAKLKPPVVVSPPVEGRWRWVGTNTVLFDPVQERLPMATE